MKLKGIVILSILYLLAIPLCAQTTLLHEFAGAYEDGMFPTGSPIVSGSYIFGMTPEGCGKGTIFKMRTDGSEYAVLHEFSGGVNDGEKPQRSLIISGTTLFGMTELGGDSNRGTIFKIENDGTGFNLLHEFSGGSDDGAGPRGSLIISGSTLYGMTYGGGDSNEGTIFKIQVDGTYFTLLHEFADNVDNGANPEGSLIISNSTLFGTTRAGGSLLNGTIFKILTDGSGFTLLHSFLGGDGFDPTESLVLSGSTLYGMCSDGGKIDSPGTIFKIETDGSGFSLLHVFGDGIIVIGENDQGNIPTGTLVLSGSTLFGMAQGGGDLDQGVVFKIQTDGTEYTLLHSFAGGVDDGRWPVGSLSNSGSTLFGMTYYAGDNNKGVVFSLALPEAIAVTSPNGGEIWGIGENHEITWTSTGSVDDVDIDYSIDDGGSWIPVIAGCDNDGTHTWTVPDTPSTLCLVRVSSADVPIVSDFSDVRFHISAPFVAVTSPNGDEKWQRGTIHDISWGSTGVENVKIQLMKGTAIYSTIAPATPATTGSFSWTIPASQPSAMNYKIRIVSTESSTMADSSDAYFSILAPTITVTTPTSGSVWVRNTVMTIAWTAFGTMDDDIKIQLYQDKTKILDIIQSTENDGSYNWLIPSNLAKGSYTIRVATLDRKVKATSGAFSIVPGIIIVTSPSSGSSWRRGTVNAIAWIGAGELTSNVKIQLYRATILVATLADAAPNSGSFDWSIPSKLALANNYRIRVSTINNRIKGISGLFAIINNGG